MYGLRIVLMAVLLAGAVAAQEGPNLVTNGGFEGEVTTFASEPDEAAQVSGTVGQAWSENSRGWTSVDATYEVRRDDPAEGLAYQRITAIEVREGKVQMMGPQVPLAAGATYEATAYVRSRTGSTVSLLLRLPGAPYTMLGETTVAVSPEWNRVRFRATSAADQVAVFMVILDGPGELDLDGVAVRVAPTQSDAPRQAGNLAPLARMGVGLPSAWTERSQDATWTAETGEGPFGPGAGKIVLGPNGRLSLETRPVRIRYGHPHTLSLSVRSDKPGATVGLAVQPSDSWQGFGDQVEPGTEWTRMVARGTLPPSADERYWLQLIVSGKNQTVWIDGLSLVEGDSEVFTPEPSVTVVPTQPWGVFEHRGRPSADVTVVGAAPGSELALTLTHVDGRTATLPNAKLSGRGVDRVRITPNEALTRDYGLVRLVGQVVGADGQPAGEAGETLLAHVPPQVAGERPDSPFGTHVTLREPDITAVARLGFKWCRLHDASILTKWALVEPKPGEWTWYDNEMRLARRRGLMICGMLCSSPPWASGHAGETGYFSIYYPPTDLDQWGEYVRRTVARYSRWIDRWEVWNEPWGNSLEQGFFRGGTPEQYAALLRRAYSEAKEANPDATILGIDTYDGAWDQAVLAAGAYESYDLLSFHRYESSLCGGPDDVFARKAAELAETQRQYGEPKPLENTEGGPGTSNKGSFFSFAQPATDGDWDYWADQVPRYYLGNLAAGVTRFYLYSLHNDHRYGQPNSWMLVEPGFLAKPLTISTSALISFLEGAQHETRLTPAAGSSAHWFVQPERRWYGPAGSVVVVAISDGAIDVPLTQPLPDGVTCYDRWGNVRPAPTSLGRQPVYIVAPAAQQDALRVALSGGN